MRISQITDPSLFQRLVRALYVAERGEAFQLVDDSGGDGGLDGYDSERSALYAAYCPTKPANDKRYLSKALEDLAKAVRLRDEGEYGIETFVFVTPQHVREPVMRKLRAEAATVGLGAISVGSTHLEDLFLKHAAVRTQFPELSYPEIQRMIGELSDRLSASEALTGKRADEEATEEPRSPEIKLFSGLAFPRVFALQDRLSSGDESAAGELDHVRLESRHPEEQLAASLVLIQFEGDRLAFDRTRSIAASAGRVAEALGHEPALAVMQAEEARSLVMRLVKLDIDTATEIAMGNRLGFHVRTPEQQQRTQADLDRLLADSERLFRTALENAFSRPNLEASFIVLLLFASSMAQRVFPYRLLADLGETGGGSAVDDLRRRVDWAYEEALRIGVAIQNDTYVSMAYSNYANDLMVFDEPVLAEAHARRALEIGTGRGDPDLIWRPKRILKKLGAKAPEAG